MTWTHGTFRLKKKIEGSSDCAFGLTVGAVLMAIILMWSPMHRGEGIGGIIAGSSIKVDR